MKHDFINTDTAFGDEFEYDGITWWRHRQNPDYYVSEDGYIASVKKGNFRILKSWPNQHGHQYVGIDGVRRSVHRVVAETFISNHNNYPIVRHLNDDPRDNRISNLAWGTQKENIADCQNHDRDYKKPVICIETGQRFRSQAAAARHFGLTPGDISWHLSGKIHAIAGGYHLRREDCNGSN